MMLSKKGQTLGQDMFTMTRHDDTQTHNNMTIRNDNTEQKELDIYDR